MLNRVVLIGRLVRDPEIRETQSGTVVASFSLAVDRPFNSNKEKETDFIPVVVWGAAAESCGKFLSQGKLAAVDGKLQVRSYTDSKNIKRSVTEVVADNVRFLSPKEGGNGGSSKGYGGKQSSKGGYGKRAFEDPMPDIADSDDDTPF